MSQEVAESPVADVAGDRHRFTAERERPSFRWGVLALVFLLVASSIGLAGWLVRDRLRDAVSEKLRVASQRAEAETPMPRPQRRVFANPPPSTERPADPSTGELALFGPLAPPGPVIPTAAATVPLPSGPLPASAGTASSGLAGGPAQPRVQPEAARASMMIDPQPASIGALRPGLASVARPDLSTGPGPLPREPGSASGLERTLVASRIDAAVAGVLAPRDKLVPRGSIIPCVLETQLVSTIAGFAACIVTEDIYSDDGRALLLERGSHVTGEYQSTLKSGDARLFVLWDRIKTPGGVVVALDSPGGDAVGGQGLPGIVDNHWTERIGAAFLLSLFQDAVTYEVARAGSRNGGSVTSITTTPTNTVDAAQSLSRDVLKSTIDIAPTIYKNRGEVITIYVARDLWFDRISRSATALP